MKNRGIVRGQMIGVEENEEAEYCHTPDSEVYRNRVYDRGRIFTLGDISP